MIAAPEEPALIRACSPVQEHVCGGGIVVRYVALALSGIFLVASSHGASHGTSHGAVTSVARLTSTLPPLAHTQFCMKYPDDCKADGKKDSVKTVPLTSQRRAELRAINERVNKSIVLQRQPANPVHDNGCSIRPPVIAMTAL
jgi:Bacterial transglutaminase-like cysteine proteinase BTLCP